MLVLSRKPILKAIIKICIQIHESVVFLLARIELYQMFYSPRVRADFVLFKQMMIIIKKTLRWLRCYTDDFGKHNWYEFIGKNLISKYFCIHRLWMIDWLQLNFENSYLFFHGQLYEACARIGKPFDIIDIIDHLTGETWSNTIEYF